MWKCVGSWEARAIRSLGERLVSTAAGPGEERGFQGSGIRAGGRRAGGSARIEPSSRPRDTPFGWSILPRASALLGSEPVGGREVEGQRWPRDLISGHVAYQGVGRFGGGVLGREGASAAAVDGPIQAPLLVWSSGPPSRKVRDGAPGPSDSCLAMSRCEMVSGFPPTPGGR